MEMSEVKQFVQIFFVYIFFNPVARTGVAIITILNFLIKSYDC